MALSVQTLRLMRRLMQTWADYCRESGATAQQWDAEGMVRHLDAEIAKREAEDDG